MKNHTSKRLFRFAISLLLMTVTAKASVVTHFDIDLSPDAQGFALASAATLVLNYTIDGTGIIALDAVASTSTDGEARWNQIDNATAGTTTSASLFNTTFTLTFSGSSTPILSFPSYNNAGTGSVLATAEGNSSALENGETAAFTLSGTATAVSGFSLDLVSFSYGNRLSNGQSSFGVEDTTGTVIEQLVPNTSPSGSISGTGISLVAGETMTFRTIDGNAGGAGLTGFEFTVTAVPEPSTIAIFAGLGALTVAVVRRRSLRK